MILVPIGEVPEDLVDALSRRTGIPSGPRKIDPAFAYHPLRNQYDSTRLLTKMKALYKEPVAAVTSYDLFIPVLTYVFGEAEMNGRVAIFSFHRLREEFYGMPANRELLLTRSLKELWHELGHLYGLPHCPDASCIMSSSHSVELVDAKEECYCKHCLNRIPGAAPTPGTIRTTFQATAQLTTSRFQLRLF